MKVQRLSREGVGEDIPEMVCINFYVLEDPRNSEIRYVGITNNPENRLRNHIYEAKKYNRNHKERWIVSLLRRNLKPTMRILWTGILEEKDANKIETKLIKRLSKKYNLTNSTDRARNVSVVKTKEVFQFSLDGKFIAKFMNANQASIATGIHDSAISIVCNNPNARGNRSRGGFLWSHSHELPKALDQDYRHKISAKKTAQYTLDGELVEVYESARIASKTTGICYKRISACLNGRQKTAGGFIWKLMKI